MGKKHRQLKKKGNLIVFPNTLERLLAEGMQLLKEGHYREAENAFRQVLDFEPEDAAALGAYAYSLFELEDYEAALEACEQLLKVGPIRYLETMELYISILMQLRRYNEAEMTIQALIGEDILPRERLEQFEQLRALNERIVEQTPSNIDLTPFKPETFIKLPPAEQESLILDLPSSAYAAAKTELLAIAGHPEADMLTKTYILFMLHQEEVSAEVEIRKFHYTGIVNTLDLPDPVHNDRLREIRKLFADKLEKDPSRLDIVLELFDRHVYLIYPFLFEEFSTDEIAYAYVNFVEQLFSEDVGEAPSDSLEDFIAKAERWFEARNNLK
ncbi:tetratricopeptide repeat protein [Planomicrobium sp. YIM 101495]|uniref:tetratricopeptide repeat protein n=1 Tax=Planomicrobium sp. YIM 101495 TaxID=2665160 RepID=UPI0012B82673|nr:tetratricopeptide repeat protein [Planomicrobium sp. YIM 101495]MTD29646.1 tetratricopeptide repeat protein [Planomicrobium sp. YIM 101495]